MADRPARSYAIPAGSPIAGVTYLYASAFSVMGSANDFTLVLHDTMPIADDEGVSRDQELRRPVGIVKLSPQSMKELSQILATAVSDYERIYKVSLTTDGMETIDE